MVANESFKNRSSYVKHYETVIRDVVGSTYGTDDSEMWEIVTKKFVELITYERWTDFKRLFIPEFLENWLKKISADEGIPYEAENLKPLTSIIHSLKNHPIMLYALVTQTESLAQAHYPELCLAWLQSQDPNYTEGGKASFVSGNYRIIRINCPVDVEVYNDENQLVAAIINDEPQELTSLVSSINENGEKLIYLPPDADYSVKLTATDDGKMSYAINEYSYAAGEVTRISNYYDLPLQKGQAYTGQIPAYTDEELENGTEDGTNVSYTLVDERTKQTVTPDVELAGEEAPEAEYQIIAESADEEQGIVFGGGLYKVGNFVQLAAVPNEGYEFVGWYQNEKQVSTEENYRFRVETEQHLIAKFKPKKGQGSDNYNLLHGKFDPEKNVVKAGDWQTFINAYKDETVTKIVLTKNIEDSSPNGAKGPTSYKRKKSIEIDGQGHRLTLKKYHSLRTSEAPDSYQEVVEGQAVSRSMFHLHDISLRQNMNGRAASFGQYSSNAFIGALDTHSSWGKEVSSREEDLTKNWYFRFGNIDTKEDNNSANARGLARLVMAYGAEVTLYGSLDLSTAAENMYVGSLIVEDDTVWKGNTEYDNLSLVWFVLGDQKRGTGRSEELTIGKNCEITLKNSVKGKNYPAFYGHYKQAVIDENATVMLETKGNAWRFDQSGSSLTIKKDAVLNLTSNGNGKVVQFGRGPLSPTKISNCQLKVEPGGSLFVKGKADRAGGISVIDFIGGYNFTSSSCYGATNCTIELYQPKAYNFSNRTDSKKKERQSVLNLRNNSNKFIVKNADIAIWKTGRSLAASEQQQPDQRMTEIEHFELVGKQGSNHSQDIQGLPNYQELFGKDIRRISNE